jgi:hypothetical protein
MKEVVAKLQHVPVDAWFFTGVAFRETVLVKM